jgi:dienelactone hydrolase
VKVFRDLAHGDGPAFDKARASIDFLASQYDVDEDRLGLVGFCMGGDSLWRLESMTGSE